MSELKDDKKKTPSPQSVINLIEDLRSPDLPTRLATFRRLPEICDALGPVRTREEFIPYLAEFTDEEDEILLILCDALGKLIDQVGGASYAYVLIPPLEVLAAAEESSIREKAVSSLTSIIKALQPTDPTAMSKYVIPLVRRLATSSWFPGREAVCQLFHLVYPRSNPTLRKELRGLFINLCTDTNPTVRRAACKYIGKLVSETEYEDAKAELWSVFVKLSEDDQDSVRLLSVESAVDIAKLFRTNNNVSDMIPIIMKLYRDKSWRVRYVVADRICDLWQAIGDFQDKDNKYSTSSGSGSGSGSSSSSSSGSDGDRKMEEKVEEESLVDGYVRLLRDSEPEVRTAAAQKVGEMSKLMGRSVTLTKLLPSIKVLTKDASQYTRAALGSVIMGIAGVISKEEVETHLLPLFLQLLKDTHPEVRLNIIAKLDTVNQVIGVDELAQSLLPAISELATDKKWRVRLAIIRHIPLLAKQLGPSLFETKLNDLCMSWLADSVYQIRNAATTNLTRLVIVFGGAWALIHIIPRVKILSEHKSYLYRMTAVAAMKSMSREVGVEITSEKLVPLVAALIKDPVPNVRFNVAKALGVMSLYVTPTAISSLIIPTLQTLSRDTDLDVQYFVSQALLSVKNIQEGKTSLASLRASNLESEAFDSNLETSFLSSYGSLSQGRASTSEDEDHEMAIVDGLPHGKGAKGGR